MEYFGPTGFQISKEISLGLRAILECHHLRGNKEVQRVVGFFGETKQCGGNQGPA